MALQQIIQHPTGTASHYWKVRAICLDHTAGTGNITVDGYVSPEARQSGKVPLDHRTVVIENYAAYFAPAIIDAAGMNEVKAAYLYLKSLQDGEFYNATDV